MTKEYGKLTADQFREFIELLPELLRQLHGMGEQFAGMDSVAFEAQFSEGFGLYSYIYEQPFQEHLGAVIVGLNRLHDLEAIASAPDPQQALIDSIKTDDEDKPLHDAFGGPTVRYALATGCRAAEITGLEWCRVDLNRRTAWLNQTKNGTPRGVPLNEDAIEVLKEQIGKHQQFCFTHRGERIKWEPTNSARIPR
jgi:hypothetical protein